MNVRSFYVPGRSLVHRLHPVTKLAVLGGAMLAAFAREDAGRQLAAAGPWLMLLGILAAASAGGVLRALVGALLRTVLPIVVSLYLLQGVIAVSRGGLDWSRGPLLAVGGILSSTGTLGLRLVVFVGAVLLLLLTTHAGQLVQALVAKGAPPWLGYVVVAAMQILPATVAQSRAISDAQRVRGLQAGSGGVRARLQAVPPLMVPLLLAMLQGTEEQAMALQARGLGRSARRTCFTPLAEQPWEPAAQWLCLLAGAAAFAGLRGWFG